MKYIFIVTFFLAGCSHSILTKKCNKVENEELYVCKTVLPWQ